MYMYIIIIYSFSHIHLHIHTLFKHILMNISSTNTNSLEYGF